MDAEFEALSRVVRKRRKTGEVLLHLVRRTATGPAEEELRALLRDPPAPLVADASDDLDVLDEISPQRAETLLAAALGRDLAYRVAVMPVDVAAELARQLVEVLEPGARWWTNGDVADRGNFAAWNPLTEATFDSGVIGISETRTLIAWVMDED